MATTKEIKELYISGHSITEIANILNLTRQTIYRRKRKDEQSGLNWDEARLLRKRSPEDIKEKETIFLNTLISSFDKFIKQADKNDGLDGEILDKLNSYARTYWNLKAPVKMDTKELTLEVATKTLQKIASLALDLKDNAVVSFLSVNSEKIIKEVLGK